MEDFQVETADPKAKALQMIDEAARLCEEEGLDFGAVLEEYQGGDEPAEGEVPEAPADVDDEPVPAAEADAESDEDVGAKKKMIVAALKRKMG